MKRFYDKVNKKSLEECWEWKAAIRNGYGAFKYNGKVESAHRVAYIIHKGKIPEGMFVCHKCDNRKCVNPNHLFLGTQSDNMKDAYNKGRLSLPRTGNFKPNHIAHNATMTRENAIKIKKRIDNRSKTLKQLGEELNIPHHTMRDISAGRIYKI